MNSSLKMVKYFTADEISMHNCAADCWVSIFDNVYDLTALLEANKGIFLLVPKASCFAQK